MTRLSKRVRTRSIAAALIALTLVATTTIASALVPSTKVDSTEFSLFPNPANLGCLRRPGDPRDPRVDVQVQRGELNDTLILQLHDFKSNLDFDLFTVQNSNQQADGSPVVGFANFGLAWYQSDLHSNDRGRGSVRIKTILLDQIFGFDPAVGLAPTNTFHVGFWFNNPGDAAGCGFTGFTPFNGEHMAGPLAFISRPDATTGLGPLCTDPTTKNGTTVCNP